MSSHIESHSIKERKQPQPRPHWDMFSFSFISKVWEALSPLLYETGRMLRLWQVGIFMKNERLPYRQMPVLTTLTDNSVLDTFQNCASGYEMTKNVLAIHGNGAPYRISTSPPLRRHFTSFHLISSTLLSSIVHCD